MNRHRQHFLKKRIATALPKPLWFFSAEDLITTKVSPSDPSNTKVYRQIKSTETMNQIRESVTEKCLRLSHEILTMDPAERMVFMTDETNFPRQEKTIMLDACINVLEQVEQYENCATLLKLRMRLAS